MSAMVFTLRESPNQRLDLSPLIPDRLAGLSLAEIERIELQTTREKVTAGDVFRVTSGSAASLRFAGGSERFDRIGAEMKAGEILVDGDVGSQAGRNLSGGTLTVSGSTGPWAGSRMSSGHIVIGGHAGDWLGGPLPGELAGMSGGTIHVKGNAGAEAGHRLRRGTIAVEGKAGPYAGRAMIAGTLIVAGRAGPNPGYLMQRGTIVLGKPPQFLSPTFLDCGAYDLVFARLLERALQEKSMTAGLTFNRPMRRYAGDAASLGRGEILITKS